MQFSCVFEGKEKAQHHLIPYHLFVDKESFAMLFLPSSLATAVPLQTPPATPGARGLGNLARPPRPFRQSNRTSFPGTFFGTLPAPPPRPRPPPSEGEAASPGPPRARPARLPTQANATCAAPCLDAKAAASKDSLSLSLQKDGKRRVRRGKKKIVEVGTENGR